MINSNINHYLSASYTDGELLTKAEYLRNELKTVYSTCHKIAEEYTCVADLVTANDKLQRVTEDLEKVVYALEENCYDCSWYKS